MIFLNPTCDYLNLCSQFYKLLLLYAWGVLLKLPVINSNPLVKVTFVAVMQPSQAHFWECLKWCRLPSACLLNLCIIVSFDQKAFTNSCIKSSHFYGAIWFPCQVSVRVCVRVPVCGRGIFLWDDTIFSFSGITPMMYTCLAAIAQRRQEFCSN